MKQKLIVILVVAAGLLSGLGLFAQEDPCANPKSGRVAVLIASKEPEKSASAKDQYSQRVYSIERQFREVLVKKLSSVCVVQDDSIFSDPNNYPALKGSMIINIAAEPSFKNPKTAALAVVMYASEGPYAEQSFPMGFLPVLIEDDSDFEKGANGVLHYWATMGKLLSHK